MSRALRSRVARLEAAQPDARYPEKWHSIIGDSKAECEAKAAELIALGKAKESDGFIHRIIVSPPAWEDAQ